MSLDQDFERIVGWFARLNGGVDEMRDGQATTQAMLDSAEYELDQLRRDVAAVSLEPLVLGKVA
jgi:hypothetical protein